MSGRYQILSPLGSGGQATVFRAWDTLQNRDVAFKRLFTEANHTGELLYEARQLYALRHPNIVTVHEYGTDESGPYLVMEMLKGQPLSKVLENAPLNQQDFTDLVQQTLSAVAAAHEAGIIHRDLKPDNLMVLWDSHARFQVKLFDFGLAHELPPLGKAAPRPLHGSVHYMSPEQFRGEPIDFRSDLYALGVIYYLALTQKHPAQGETRAQVITSHLHPQHQPLAELRPDLPKALCFWVERLLQPDPKERPASAEAALSAFNLIVDGEAPAIVEEEEPVVAPAILEEEPSVLLVADEEETAAPALVVAEEPIAEEPQAAAAVAAVAEDESIAAPAPEPELVTTTEESPVLAPANLTPAEIESPIVAAEEEAPTFVESLEEPSLEVAPMASQPAPVEESTPAMESLFEEEPEPASLSPQPEIQLRSLEKLQSISQENTPAIAAHSMHRPASAPRSGFGSVLLPFLAVVFGLLAFISFLRYSSREERMQRFEELKAAETPQASDIDVRMLFDFLDDPATREDTAKLFARLQGGEYIDQMLVKRLQASASTSTSIHLAEICGKRRISSAFDALLKLTEDSRREMRDAAWNALSEVTILEQVPRLLKAFRRGNSQERAQIEKSLSHLIETIVERPEATQMLLQAYQEATDNAERRALLFNVITRVGGEGTLKLVTEAIADPSPRVRLEAITVLAEYPDHDPLPAITERFPIEKDNSCRLYLLLAAKELVSRPGSLTQETLARHAQSLYSQAKDSDEKDYALNVVVRVLSANTVTFFENYAKTVPPDEVREANELHKDFHERMKQLIPISVDGGRTPLPPEQADYQLGGSITADETSLNGWRDPKDWATWLVEIPRNGEYEIDVYQSFHGAEPGIYEVLLAGKTLLTAMVDTGNANTFKGFIAGKVKVSQPGTYRVWLRPKKIHAASGQFRVQKLAIKAL